MCVDVKICMEMGQKILYAIPAASGEPLCELLTCRVVKKLSPDAADY